MVSYPSSLPEGQAVSTPHLSGAGDWGQHPWNSPGQTPAQRAARPPAGIMCQLPPHLGRCYQTPGWGVVITPGNAASPAAVPHKGWGSGLAVPKGHLNPTGPDPSPFLQGFSHTKESCPSACRWPGSFPSRASVSPSVSLKLEKASAKLEPLLGLIRKLGVALASPAPRTLRPAPPSTPLPP